MPYSPTNPTTEQVMVPEDHSLDVYHIHSFMVSIDPNDPQATSIHIAWSKGFIENDTYYPCFQYTNDFTGQTAIDAVMAEVTPGNTRYTEDKIALWTLLQDGGYVGPGSIT